MEQKTTEFREPGTFPTPGLFGRVVRIVAGLFLIYFFIKTITGYKSYVAYSLPGGTWWIGAAAGFYFLSDVVNIGFARSWSRWPQAVALFLALGAVVFDLFQYGNIWGPPLGMLIYILMVFVLGALGLSFLLAGILAVPG
ncbi:MAG: hypothetical protein ACYTBZ_31005 [Planctomycetota bacterium]|jgi:hypothetical protein